jgi:drug/metabolite transporter (DMT)-like permease
MLSQLWPLFLVIFGSTAYNLCAKETPQNIQPFASLTLTYLVSAGISLILFFVFSEDKNLLAELTKANRATFVLGIVLVLLEVGWIYMYRVGWKLGIGSLIANIGLTCSLLLIGILFYKEVITLRQLAGVLLCMGSMFLLAK